jgi:ubiquinone/menaquinone biosynthesis C-methylase UbiE
MYLRMSQTAEKRGATQHRERLLEGLTGTVVEVGAGQGLNFPHYPQPVSEVIAVEPEPTLRDAAVRAAAAARVAVRVIAGLADTLPLGDASVDAAVASLVLCSVPDQARALAELRRVLRPGGQLRFYEHVIAESQPKRALLQLLDHSTLWPRIAGGCHPARDTSRAITDSGFVIESPLPLGLASHLMRSAPPAGSSSIRSWNHARGARWERYRRTSSGNSGSMLSRMSTSRTSED